MYKKQNHPWSTPWSTSQSRKHRGSRHSRVGAGQGGAWLWGTEEARGAAQRGVWWSGRASQDGLHPGWALRGKEEVCLKQSRWTLQAACVFRDVDRVQGCMHHGEQGWSEGVCCKRTSNASVDMDMALIPCSVMGVPVELSTGSTTDGIQRLTSRCWACPKGPAPAPCPKPSVQSLWGTGGREKDATIQCLKYILWSRHPGLRAQRKGAGYWGWWTGGEGGRSKRVLTETESWEREHKGRKSKTVERLERIVPGEGHTRGWETWGWNMGGLCHCEGCRVGVGWRVWAEAKAQRSPHPELSPSHSSLSGLPGGVTSLGTFRHPYSQATCPGERWNISRIGQLI